MLRVHRPQPLGWMPPADEDCLHVDSLSTYSERKRSFSPLSTSSSHSDTDHTSFRTTGSNPSHRHHDPSWVARPRNAFIIFRCEYSQIHCRQGPRVRHPPGTSKEPTLSKRAALAWKQMTSKEKEPYKIRAEEERSDHARKHPEYRFRPQRRLNHNTRYNLRPGTNVTFPYPGVAHDICDGFTPFVSPGCTASRLSISVASSPVVSSPDLSLNNSASISGWTPPLACHVPDVEWGVIKPTDKQSFVAPELSHPDVDTPAVLPGWNDLPGSMPTVDSVEPIQGHMQSIITSNVVDFPPCEYPAIQYHSPYPDIDTVWSSHIPVDFQSLSSAHMHNVADPAGVVSSLIQPITISNYTTLADAVFA